VPPADLRIRIRDFWVAGMLAEEPDSLKKRCGLGWKEGMLGGRFVFTAVMQVVSRSSRQRGSTPDLSSLLAALAASYPISQISQRLCDGKSWF